MKIGMSEKIKEAGLLRHFSPELPLILGIVAILSPISPHSIHAATLIDEDFSTGASNFTAVAGGSWSVSSGRYVVSSPATGSSNAILGNISVHDTSVGSDFVLAAVVNLTATSSWDDAVVVFGYQDLNNYYYVSLNENNDGNTKGIFKVVSGSPAELADITATIADDTDYDLEVERSGSSIVARVNGNEVASTTDSTFSSGKVGFGTYNDAASFDDLLVTDSSSGDTEAPSVPTGVAAGTITTTTVALSWNASTDNVGVTGYKVYTDGSNPISVTGTNTTVSGLTHNTGYTFTVSAVDAASNESSQSSGESVTTVDGEAPSVPTGLSASNETATTVDLDWNASSDNVGVSGYRIYTDGSNPVSVSTTSVTLTGLTPDTTYVFTVSAYDAAGNESEESNSVNATTGASSDYLAANVVAYWGFNSLSGGSTPDDSGNGNTGTVTGGVSSSTGQIDDALDFNGSTGKVSVGSLDVTPDSGNDGITIAAWIHPDNWVATSYDDRIISKATGTGEQDHYWMLSPIKSGSDARLRFRLKAGGSTTTLISSSGNIQLDTWTHVAGTYDGSTMRVFVDGTQIGSVSKTGTVDTSGSVAAAIGINPDDQRPFDGLIDEVYLLDRGLSASEIGDLMVRDTSTPSDTEAPSAPSGLSASNETDTTVDLDWNASTDNVGVTGYKLYTGGSNPVDVGNVTSVTATGLSPETTYTFTVSAYDAADNESSQSSGVNVTTEEEMEQVAAPQFSPGGGSYSSTQNVTISTSTTGATIRYTIDGSTPSQSNGTVYSGTVAIAASTTLKAVAYKSGMTDSSVTMAGYTITGGSPTKPSASNTGPRYSLTSSSGSLTVTTDGAVVEKLDRSGTIYVEANNVTIRDCKISSGGPYAVQQKSGYSGLTVEYCEIRDMSSAGVYCVNGWSHLRYNNVWNSGNDAFKPASSPSGNPTIIEYNYVHELGYISNAHADGVQLQPGSNVIVRYNFFDGTKNIPTVDPNDGSATYKNSQGCIFQTAYGGAVNNIQIIDNWFEGYTTSIQIRDKTGDAYDVDPTNSVVTGNWFGPNTNTLWIIDGTKITSCNRWEGAITYQSVSYSAGDLVPGQTASCE